MNAHEVSLLVIQRHKALKELSQLKCKYVEHMTIESYELMRQSQQYYHSFQDKIYSHENMIEMLELLKESSDSKIILDEIDGQVITLTKSRNDLPMLRVEDLKETVKLPTKKLKEMTDDEILKLKPIHLKALKTMDKLENE